jgi:ABC-2 type transport system ATP-binding protein
MRRKNRKAIAGEVLAPLFLQIAKERSFLDTVLPAVAVHALRKTYPGGRKGGAKEALKGISLAVPQGAFFGILGPNGAGKSTLINILAGLVRKTSGTAEIMGHDIERAPRGARRSIGVVPQELVLDTFFTVREALDIHAGYYGIPKARRRTEEIIEAMGLAEQADMPSRRLSGGMRRRLLIGKALVHSPPVLVLDEPTAGVDVELRTQLWDYVRRLNRAGTTVLLTTHYLEEAEQLCDSVAIISRGEIVVSDQTERLIRAFGGKRLTLFPAAPIAALPPSLAGQGWRLTEGGALEIRYQPGERDVGALLAQAQESGVSIHDLATREAELEEVFRHLTANARGDS